MKAANDKTLQVNIIKRFMTAEAFDAFYKQYLANRKPVGLKPGEVAVPTVEELQVASMVKDLGVKETVAKSGLDHKTVYQYVTKVARYEFLKG